ncbi:Multidrug/Oligosaccharidyl-lipid/Polysaccharide (MOP) Flippase Superfamily [Thraustotheca clavata]|uniref:Multidrug/Oligosaccharidyl-lipid/Polysaccharide (MOP) Flippase Superfamily n=1 Tax=Thraustotheca clavata TaxID=74557 RepID=A0A1W0A6E3_9STRA|nr:Multidrug/Oligosaccharidyl-lipid/Polysaccharide (MOP) Flippase Superfamily [Thraustotheca clavata]
MEETKPLHPNKEYVVDINVEITPCARLEGYKMFHLAYPVFFAYLLETLPGTICVSLVGHINSTETNLYIDAAYLSATVTNITALAIGFGLASAMDTLCSQAFGAGKLNKLGIYLQSGVIVLGLSLFPIAIMNWHADKILILFGQNESVAILAGQFSRITMLGVPFLFLYELIKKLMQAQNIVLPMTFIAFIGVAVNIATGYYMTYYTSYGYLGAAMGRVVGNIALPLSIIPYMYYNQENTSKWWPGIQFKEAYEHVPLFLSLGIPSMVMMAVSWWAFCCLAFLAGLLPNSIEAVSINSVLGNLLTASFMIFLGIAIASNVGIGNSLGANQPKRAQLISQLGLYSGFGSAFLMGSLYILFRHQLPILFISDEHTIQHVAATIFFMVPLQVFDGLNGICEGIFRGQGRQKIAAVINICSYYMLGLPLAYIAGFVWQFNIAGVWLGFTVGCGTCFFIFFTMIKRTNWVELAAIARARVEL